MISTKTFFKSALFILVIVFTGTIDAQNTEEVLNDVLKHKKRFDIIRYEQSISSLKNEHLKRLFTLDLYYQKNGLVAENEILDAEVSNLKMKAVSKYLRADLLKTKQKHNDSAIFQLYFDALNLSRQLKDTLLVNIILPKINKHLLRNGRDLNTYNKYILLSKKYAKDSIDTFQYYYFRIGYHMRKIEFYNTKPNQVLFDSLFTKGNDYAVTPYFKGYIKQFQGIFYDAFLFKPQEAINYYKESEELYNKSDLFYSSKGISSIAFNKAILNFELAKYRMSINYFRKHEKIEKEPVFLMYNFEWLYKNYEKMNMPDSAHYYFKKMVSAKDALDLSSHVVAVRDIETRYNIKEKDKELLNLVFEQKELKEKNKYLIFILGAIFLACVMLFYFLKKSRLKGKLLEEEKYSTITKIEELKNIVTKDFITLNDKTKVYVSELIYIKSDDHYLKVYLSNGKNNFVRGKLKAILEELPPNFIRVHRSYIVNINFIKQKSTTILTLLDGEQIPVSRTYGKNINILH